MSGAFYNEIDPQAAAWLRELIAQGLIAPGTVDERDIQDISPADLRGFTQVHLFAGIGGWSYALRCAGWPDSRPVWTASCPCQPFSSAGKGAGFDDERHLWPAVDWLAQQCRPECILGEQVASKDAEPWLDLVQADLEGLGYAFGACAFPSAGVGAPHIRDRTYWVADTDPVRSSPGPREQGLRLGKIQPERPSNFIRLDDAGGAGLERQRSGHSAEVGHREGSVRPVTSPSELGGMADPHGRHAGAEWEQRGGQQRQQPSDGSTGDVGHSKSGRCGEFGDAPLAREGRYLDGSIDASGRLANSDGIGTHSFSGDPSEAPRLPQGEREPEHDADVSERGGADHGGLGVDRGYGLPGHNSGPGPTNGRWSDADWLFCRDGKWRPVEPGTFPLAHGAPSRVGRLRGYGNAINAEAASAFIRSYLEVRAAA